jgi:uncharacterized membrane protein YeaQ/YmgE (transglycosylase-associated protein family)
MEIIHLITFLLIGLAAGWLSGKIMKTNNAGLLVNLIIGVIGSFVGGIIFWLIGLTAWGLLGNLVAATVGAVALLYGIKYFKRI